MNLPDDIHPKIDTTTYKFPVSQKVAGVLSYYLNGEKKYLLIERWESLPPLHYP